MNDQTKPRAEPEYRSIKSLFTSSKVRRKFTVCLVILVRRMVANLSALVFGKDRLMLGYFQTFLLTLKPIPDNPSEKTVKQKVRR
jgi:hypothetical protein